MPGCAGRGIHPLEKCTDDHAPRLLAALPMVGALCRGCGQGFVIAFSCKGRGVCPSCNGRHMAQTAANLVDHAIPPVPMRQWVISVPKRAFASGRRPGWLRPRGVGSSHILANHSSRLRFRLLVARPPTGASSCRPTTIGHSSERRIDELPAIDIHRALSSAGCEASKPEKRQTGTRSAHTREERHRSGCGAFRKTRSGRLGRSSRGSRVAHRPEDRCRIAVGRAIILTTNR